MIHIDIHKKLKDFDLEVQFETREKRVGILGASGSGKSMTLNMISGIETPDSGEISIDGRVLYSSRDGINLSPQERNLGHLFQDYAIFPHLSVRGNLEILKVESGKIDELLKLFSLKNIQDQRANQISGGEKQRLAMARMMSRDNAALLFDEPFSALDYALKQRLKFELIEQLKNFDGPYIIVSHANAELYEFTDELIVLDHGKILLHDKTEEIFSNPKKLKVAELIGVENIFSADSTIGRTIPKSGDYFGIYERDVKVGKGDIGWKINIKERIKNPFSYDYLAREGIRFKSIESFSPGESIDIHVPREKVHSLSRN